MKVAPRVQELYDEQRNRLMVQTDRMFAILMAVQWAGGIIAAAIVSPRTWAGSISSTHVHVWSALICGGLISGLPIYLVQRHPGQPVTRYTIAIAQSLWSALLIHLTGGRIETHFHVFGSLAFLAIYRDWRVLIPATAVITADHAIRGIFWPQSVYGVLTASPFRTLEHAAWVVFEDIVLIRSCRQSASEMWLISHQRAELEATNERIEHQVQVRTEQLHESLSWKAVLLDTAADGIITIDHTGKILEFNLAAKQIFGHESTAVIGRNVSMLMPDPYTVEHDSYLQRYLETGETKVIGQRREVVGLRADGSTFPIDLSVSEVKRDGEQTFTGIIRDQTAQKTAQEEIARIHEDLKEASRRAGMAEVATGVLHNVGNVLNSVNVSASLAMDRLRDSRVSGLSRAAALLSENGEDLGRYLTEDERGRQLPEYLGKLAEHLADEQESMLNELSSLTENVNHIKNIVSMQQSYATTGGVMDNVSVNDLVEEAIRFSAASLMRHEITTHKDFAELPPINTDKQKVIQILVNLIRNGKQAISELGRKGGAMWLRTELATEAVRIHVQDEGIGIPEANLQQIFQHGFTTKEEGHGFGLHHSANSARELGGSLSVHSDGSGRGATFTLELPLSASEVPA